MASDDGDQPDYSRRTPRLGARAFACPYCRAFTEQRWFDLTADAATNAPAQHIAEVRATLAKRGGADDVLPLDVLKRYLAAVEEGHPILETTSVQRVNLVVSNAWLSECWVCKRPALWIGDRLSHPVVNLEVPEPNGDLSPDIRRDYQEAAAVVGASPRAAAALLRLGIEKLCREILETPGAKIDTMIAELVAKGLTPMVQQALDFVRVIGNESVHAGELDLRDDHETAMALFDLVNLVAEQLISTPRKIAAMYSSLPARKLAGIEARDRKALPSPESD